MNIRKGDLVQVTSGNDKGKRGKVLSVSREKNRAIVEGIRMMKRHTRPTQRDPQGGIVEREATIHVSNLMVICPDRQEEDRERQIRADFGAQRRNDRFQVSLGACPD